MNKKIIIGIIVVLLLIGGGVLFKKQQDKVAAQAVKDNTIKIVTSTAVKGIGGPPSEGIQLALEEANFKAGKFTIDYVLENNGDEKAAWNAEKEKANAQKAVADPDVMLYLVPVNSGASKVSIPITNAAGLALLSSGASYQGLTQKTTTPGEPEIFYPTGKQTFFRNSPTISKQAPFSAIWAKEELGIKSVFIVDDTDLYGIGISTLFEQKCKELGITVLGRKSITMKEPIAIDRAINDIIKQKPDLVYFGGLANAGAVPLFKGLRAKGVTSKFMGPHGLFVASFLPEIGKDGEGIYISSNSGDNPSDPRFIGPVEKAANERFTKRWGHAPGFLAMTSYEGTKVALMAIEKAGVKDRAAILKALSETKDYDGIFGKWSFLPNGDTTLVPNVSINVIKNGKFELIKPLSY